MESLCQVKWPRVMMAEPRMLLLFTLSVASISISRALSPEYVTPTPMVVNAVSPSASVAGLDVVSGPLADGGLWLMGSPGRVINKTMWEVPNQSTWVYDPDPTLEHRPWTRVAGTKDMDRLEGACSCNFPRYKRSFVFGGRTFSDPDNCTMPESNGAWWYTYQRKLIRAVVGENEQPRPRHDHRCVCYELETAPVVVSVGGLQECRSSNASEDGGALDDHVDEFEVWVFAERKMLDRGEWFKLKLPAEHRRLRKEFMIIPLVASRFNDVGERRNESIEFVVSGGVWAGDVEEGDDEEGPPHLYFVVKLSEDNAPVDVEVSVVDRASLPRPWPRKQNKSSKVICSSIADSTSSPLLFNTICHVSDSWSTKEVLSSPQEALELGRTPSQLYLFQSNSVGGFPYCLDSFRMGSSATGDIPRDILALIFTKDSDSDSQCQIHIVDVRGQLWSTAGQPCAFQSAPDRTLFRTITQTSWAGPAHRDFAVSGSLRRQPQSIGSEGSDGDVEQTEFAVIHGGLVYSPKQQPQSLGLVWRESLHDTWLLVTDRLELILLDDGRGPNSPRLGSSGHLRAISIYGNDGGIYTLLLGLNADDVVEIWRLNAQNVVWEQMKEVELPEECFIKGDLEFYSLQWKENGFFCVSEKKRLMFVDVSSDTQWRAEVWMDLPQVELSEILTRIICGYDICTIGIHSSDYFYILNVRAKETVRIDDSNYYISFLPSLDETALFRGSFAFCQKLDLVQAFTSPNDTKWEFMDCRGIKEQISHDHRIGHRSWKFFDAQYRGYSYSVVDKSLDRLYLSEAPTALQPNPLRYVSIAVTNSSWPGDDARLLSGGTDLVGQIAFPSWIYTHARRTIMLDLSSFRRFGHIITRKNDTESQVIGGLRCTFATCDQRPRSPVDYRYGGPSSIRADGPQRYSSSFRWISDESAISSASSNPQPPPRFLGCHTTLFDKDDWERRLVLAGGITFTFTDDEHFVWDDIWILEGYEWVNATSLVTTVRARPKGRFGAVCSGGEKHMYMYGGMDVNYAIMDDLWRFDAFIYEWDELKSLSSDRPKPLAFPLMEVIEYPRGRFSVVLIGGRKTSDVPVPGLEPWLENTEATSDVWMYTSNGEWILSLRLFVAVDSTQSFTSWVSDAQSMQLTLTRTDEFATNFASLTVSVSCPAGTQHAFIPSPCEICGKGEYSTRTNSYTCTKCPTGSTTAATGSTSLSDCSICHDYLCSIHASGCLVDPVNRPGWWKCVCPEGFYGPKCDEQCPVVAGLVCSGNGTCRYDQGEAQCICSKNYFGQDCSKKCPGFVGGDPHQACSGHGTCDDGNHGIGECFCESGYFGNACGQECPGGADNPCESRGMCDDGSKGSGACKCREPFMGEVCEVCQDHKWGADCSFFCDGFDGVNKSCFGHGICFEGVGGTGRCECYEGFGGLGCQLECPGSTDTGVCSDHGSCDQGSLGTATCTCEWMWVGNACNINWVLIVAPTVGLLVVGAALYLLKKKFSYFRQQGRRLSALQRRWSEMGTAIRNREREWEVSEKDFDDIEVIGSGASAQVIRAYWKSGGKEVAKKKYFDACDLEQFSEEVAILKTLRHPNVVMMWGACPKTPFLAMELLERKSLHDEMLVHGEEFTWARRVSIAVDVARGMEYLHSRTPPVYHRDLTLNNVFLSRDWTAKVGDFGISKRKKDALSTLFAKTSWVASRYISKSELGTNMAYAAPEVLEEIYGNSTTTRGEVHGEAASAASSETSSWTPLLGKVTTRKSSTLSMPSGGSNHRSSVTTVLDPLQVELVDETESFDQRAAAADVYAFSMVLYGLCTVGLEPWHSHNVQEVVAAVMESKRPNIPIATPLHFAELIQDCWQQDWRHRPSFPTVRGVLEELLWSFAVE